MNWPVDNNDPGCETGLARAITSMQKPNKHYRVLVFNQCEARLQYLARTGHSLHIVPPQHNIEKRWRSGLWPLPATVIETDRAASAEEARAGGYDMAFCQTIADLVVARQWELPVLWAPLGLLGADGRALYERLCIDLADVHIVFASQRQRESWGLDGAIIGPGIDIDDWVPGTGAVAEVLYCGDAERQGVLAGLPVCVLDPHCADALELLQSRRVMFSNRIEGAGDGEDEWVLAAMAAGVPVVSAAPATELAIDGHNGFASLDYRYLRERLRATLAEPKMAAELGRNARQTVVERYPLCDRIAEWNVVIAACVAGTAGFVPPQKVVPKVSVALAVCGRAEKTEDSLMALVRNTADDPAYEVLVIDNASCDGTHYLLHAFEGDLRVHYNDDNVGLARACNQAAALAQGEYLVFLAQGAVPEPEWLVEMVRLAETDPSIGIVGARLQDPVTGEVQCVGIEFVDGAPAPVRRAVAAIEPSVAAVGDRDMVSGACMLIRRSLFAELDGFDDSGFKNLEDVDLCLRARERGWRIVYCPTSVVAWGVDVEATATEETLRFFGMRWQGVIASREEETAPRFRGNWEGPFLVYSSIAAVNREMVAALLDEGRCDLGLLQSEPDQIAASKFESSFDAVVKRLSQPLDENPDFHLRHYWPPDFSRPQSGKLVVMQPWEFGRIPREWVEPIRDNVDQIWAYTNYVRDCYVASGIDPDLIEVVRLGVDIERFKPGLAPLELPTEKSFKWLYVGGTVHRKGIDHLLEAYRGAFDPADDVCLVIKDIGTRTFYQNQHAGEAIRALQNDVSCPEILYITEDLPDADMPRLYATCDALVHPYRGEGFGLPVAEAMACALPVVVTAGGACDDFCDEETAYMISSERVPIVFPDGTEFAGQAWLLEPDTEALVAQMRRVYANSGEARARGRRAAARIADNFTWRHAALDAVAALDKLLPGKSVASAPLEPMAKVQIQPAAAEPLPQVALVTMGSTSAEVAAAIAAELSAEVIAIRDEEGAAKWGARLDEVWSAAQGDLLIFLGEGIEVDAADVQQLVERLQRQPDAGLAVPQALAASEEADIAEEGLWIFRRQALAAIGGFDHSFGSAAALAEAGRLLDRQDWPMIRVAECAIRGTYSPLGADCAAEFAAVRHLANGDRWRALAADDAALEAYRQAVAAKGDFVESIVVLSALLLEMGRAAEAADNLERLVALDQTSFQAYNYLGLARYQAGEVETARMHMLRAVKLNPTHVETLVNLAVLEWEQDRAAEAIGYLEQAAEFEPDNRDVIVNTGIIHAQLGNPTAGIDLLRDYLELNPRDGDAAAALADILIQCGELAAARQLAEALLALDPQYPAVQAILERIRGQEKE